jgi:predicted ATPase
VEAISHLNKGLELLSSLPATPERVRQELDLQVTLGTSLMATKGYAAPEVGHVYTRAHTLCQQIEDNAQVFTVLVGLRRFHAVRGELQTAHECADQLLVLAQKIHNREYLLEAHFALGFVLYHQGLFVLAYEHWERGAALYDARQHRSLAFTYGIDPGVHCLVYTAITLGLLGYVDQSVARKHAALTLAQELSHPFSLTLALLMAAEVHQIRREWHQTQEYAEVAIALANEQGFTLYTAVGTIVRGWALAMQTREEEGIAQMHQGLAAFQATGAELLQSRNRLRLAETYGNVRQSEEGLVYLSEALVIVEKRGDRWYEAELHRLKGALLLQQSLDNAAEAESSFQKTLNVARHQQAKSLELRAATSLSRLWQQQGKRQEAHDLLSHVYGWFTEGFDTADLKEAKALIEEVGS